MKEIIRDLLVPGGTITALIAWLASTGWGKVKQKTPTAEVHADEAKRIADDSGLTAEYRQLYLDIKGEQEALEKRRKEDHVRIAQQGLRIDQLKLRIDEVTVENRELKRRNDYLMWRDAEHLAYEDALTEHIDRQLPPPGPQRPYHLKPFPKE